MPLLIHWSIKRRRRKSNQIKSSQIY